MGGSSTYLRSKKTNSAGANASNASKSELSGCICAHVRNAAPHCAVTVHQINTPANTPTPADIRSSPQPKWVSVGCTAIRTMRSRSIKLWCFVYRSCRLKRFHKCCSHRPVAGPPRRCSFTLGRRPAGPWLQRLFTLNWERRMPRVPQFSLTYAAR